MGSQLPLRNIILAQKIKWRNSQKFSFAIALWCSTDLSVTQCHGNDFKMQFCCTCKSKPCIWCSTHPLKSCGNLFTRVRTGWVGLLSMYIRACREEEILHFRWTSVQMMTSFVCTEGNGCIKQVSRRYTGVPREHSREYIWPVSFKSPAPNSCLYHELNNWVLQVSKKIRF